MEILKINFVDFWPDFDKQDNYFFKLLSTKYQLEICEEPELIFYSCFGSQYLQYTCLRIFYTGENFRPDFTGCDYALSFVHTSDSKHFRLPFYKFSINSEYDQKPLHKNLHQLTTSRPMEELAAVWAQKKKFCCMVVSNSASQKRLDFFKKLSLHKPVDSGGKTMNNVGGTVENKLLFIQDYKFVISFENASYPGYTTEKLLEAMLVDSIPIYWGNRQINKDFNKKRFLDYSDFKSDQELIEKMMEIERDPQLALAMLAEPVFNHNVAPICIKDENIFAFLEQIIVARNSTTPVAKNYKKYLHPVKRVVLKYRNIFEDILLKTKSKILN